MFFNFQTTIIHGVINDLLIVHIELFGFTLMKSVLAIFNDFLQTVHKELPDFGLPQINDFNR